MAVEPRRGCGYRKVGGLYLVSGRLSETCHRLPHPLTVCPTCGAGFPQARGWTWVDALRLFWPGCMPTDSHYREPHCLRCVVCTPDRLGDRAGLLWVGAQFYSTPAAFLAEADQLGVSRRIAALPRGFTLGETWVLLAHPYACAPAAGDPLGENGPGIFSVFKPERVELIVKQSAATAERVKGLAERGITAVPVPDDDPDHQGTAYARDGVGG